MPQPIKMYDWRVLTPTTFQSASFVTAELISSPSPFCPRQPNGAGAAANHCLVGRLVPQAMFEPLLSLSLKNCSMNGFQFKCSFVRMTIYSATNHWLLRYTATRQPILLWLTLVTPKRHWVWSDRLIRCNDRPSTLLSGMRSNDNNRWHVSYLMLSCPYLIYGLNGKIMLLTLYVQVETQNRKAILSKHNVWRRLTTDILNSCDARASLESSRQMSLLWWL